MGDVDAGEAHALCRGQQLGQRIRTEAEFLDVDQAIDVAELLLGGFTLMHRRRQGRLDRRSDEADEERGLTPRVTHFQSPPKADPSQSLNRSFVANGARSKPGSSPGAVSYRPSRGSKRNAIARSPLMPRHHRSVTRIRAIKSPPRRCAWAAMRTEALR